MHCQTDTVFWFVAPEVSQGHSDRPIALRITSFGQASTVRISQPANISFNPITVNIPANNLRSIDLTPYITYIENNPANQILNYGLLIQATSPVTAYYEVISGRNNPEIFSLKGKNALGTDFLIPAQNLYDNSAGYNPTPYSSFEIVATEDNTIITINPSHDIVGHSAGREFTIVLNRGQTYSARASSQRGTEHLYGSIVKSNKPIAITIKDDSVWASWDNCKDLTGDQIVPVELIGTEYIAVKGFLSDNYDRVFILGTRDNTKINIVGGTTASVTLNRAALTSFGFVQKSVYIKADYPVYVLHLSGFQCEFGQPLLPPIQCTGSTEVAFTRTTSEYFGLILLTQSGAEGDFTLNGSNTAINKASFSFVPGTNSQWVAASLDLSSIIPVGAASIISNKSSLFHVGIINGGDNTGCRYGYFSNYNNALHLKSSQSLCTGSDLILNGPDIPNATFDWAGPNGFHSTEKKPIISNATPAQSGIYNVAIETIFGCKDTATINVKINEPPKIELETIGNICKGDSITLIAHANGSSFSYLWSNGDTTSKIIVKEAGIYSIAVTDSIGCKGTSQIEIKPGNIIPSILATNPLCEGDSCLLSTKETYISYKWSTGETTPEIYVKNNGKYSVEVVDSDGCNGKTEIDIKFNPNPKPAITSLGKSILCEIDSVLLDAGLGYVAYEWYDEEGNKIGTGSSLVVRKSGNYKVKVQSAEGCWGTSGALALIFGGASDYLEITGDFNNGVMDWDSVWYPQVICKKFNIKNNSEIPIAIDDVTISMNTAFSIPQSQFSLWIPANETRELTVCYSPTKLGEQLDTLIIKDICSVHRLPLRALGLADTYYSEETKCNVTLKAKVRGFSQNYQPKFSEPYPNPATDNIFIDVLNPNPKLIIDSKLYNTLGKVSGIGRYENDKIIFSLIDLANGIYSIILNTNGYHLAFLILIAK